MASIGYVKGLLGFLPTDMRRVFGIVFDHILGNLRIGLPGHQKRAENFQWYQLDAVTPATANEEFTVEHGLSDAPRVVIPVLDCGTVGASVPTVTVTRAADARRLYLSSPSTNVAITLFAESR